MNNIILNRATESYIATSELYTKRIEWVMDDLKGASDPDDILNMSNELFDLQRDYRDHKLAFCDIDNNQNYVFANVFLSFFWDSDPYGYDTDTHLEELKSITSDLENNNIKEIEDYIKWVQEELDAIADSGDTDYINWGKALIEYLSGKLESCCKSFTDRAITNRRFEFEHDGIKFYIDVEVQK